MKIPIQLIRHVLSKKRENPFRLYLYLKEMAPVRFMADKEFVDFITFECEYKTSKTFWNNLNKLVKYGWIAQNKKTGEYTRIGLAKICSREGITFSKNVKCNFFDVCNIQAFLAGACISYLAEINRLKSGDRLESNRLLHLRTNDGGWFVAINYFAKWARISKTKAQRLRQEAVNADFIKKKTNNIYYKEWLVGRKDLQQQTEKLCGNVMYIISGTATTWCSLRNRRFRLKDKEIKFIVNGSHICTPNLAINLEYNGRYV